MTEEKTQKPGVFDHIKGAHSKDPEVVEEASVESGSTETTEAEPKTDKAEGGGVDPEKSRLKTRLAQLERQVQSMGPYAQFANEVLKDEKRGKQMLQRWQQGQSVFGEEVDPGELTAREEKVMRGMDANEVVQLLDARDAQKQAMSDLMEEAEENLPHFKKIKKSQKFTKALSGALATVWNDETWYDEAPAHVLEWADENKAKNYTAIKQAYQYILATNPKVMDAAKAAGKAEQKEKDAEAIASSTGQSGATSTGKETPQETSEEDEIIKRMVNARGAGRSFGSVGRKG
jgi:hypothetical protein